MDMSGLNGTARMAYLTGMQVLQEKGSTGERMLVAARQGGASYGSFAQLLTQAGKTETPPTKTYSLADPAIAAARAELSSLSWSTTEDYMAHLKEKYGVVRVESVAHDQTSLDRAGGTMRSGHDVVLSPVALERMAQDPDKAAEIEGTIDYFFGNIPKYEAEAAAMGLTFESCGCVVHDDGTVTYICGGGDSPERVAEVERIHRMKLEKEAEVRRRNVQRALDSAQERREWEQETAEKRRVSLERMQASCTRTVCFIGR